MSADSFKDFVCDQLRAIGPVTARAMFGGYGLYLGHFFFGIVHDDRLYFKTDRSTVGHYVAQGMGPFRPNAKQTLKHYYEVPADVLEDVEQAHEWARAALAVARRGEKAPESAPSAKRSRRRR